MSDNRKYLFHKNPIQEATISDLEGIYADPSWARLLRPGYQIPKTTFVATSDSYFSQCSSASINDEYLTPKTRFCGFTGVYVDNDLPCATIDNLMPRATVYGTVFTSDNPSQVLTKAMDLGLTGFNFPTGSTTIFFNGLGTLRQTPHTAISSNCLASQHLANPCLPTTHAHLYSKVSNLNVSKNQLNIEKYNYGLIGLKTASLYGAVLDVEGWQKTAVSVIDSWIKPSAVHTFIDSSPINKLLYTPNLGKSDYLGYGDYVDRQTKDLFALHHQLSLLNEEAIWLNSKVTEDFYKSLYVPYGEDLISYIKCWSEQVIVKIQKVVAKFDRLYRHIEKLKIGTARLRRINKKRVFRTKVNLVFKNLDDAHSSGLNYLNSVNALFLTFKYYQSWKLT